MDWIRPKSTSRLREMPNMVQKVTFVAQSTSNKKSCRTSRASSRARPLNPNLNRGGCQKILAKYEEMGRSFSDCQLTKGGDLADTEVVYQITEGPKVKVQAFSSSATPLSAAMRPGDAYQIVQRVVRFIGGTYNKGMVDSDINDLYKYYHNFGYQDMRISPEIERSSDGSEVTLIFHIQEGPRYRIQDVPDVHGVKEIPREQLRRPSRFKPGDYLDETKIKTDVKFITDSLGYNGQDVRVEAVPVRLPIRRVWRRSL